MPIGARTLGVGGFGRIPLADGSAEQSQPDPCTSRKPTPAEALRLKIKLPWDGKVQRMEPKDLTKELFVEMEAYGLTRMEIMKEFHGYSNLFHAMIKGWELPPAKRGGPNRAAKSGNLEKPAANLIVKSRPGQSYRQACDEKARATPVTEEPEKILTDEELDAELKRVDAEIASMNDVCKNSEIYSPKSAENIPINIPAADPDPVPAPVKTENVEAPIGPLLRQFYPAGINPDQYNDLPTVIRMIEETFRITRKTA